MEAMNESGGPLGHVRVVDLTTARSGPTCVRQLADFGAEVVQVRSPGHGDIAGSDSANLHRNKRSIVLDLKTPGGHEAFLRLIDQADVVVENMRPSVKHRLGIDPETLWVRNPGLIYASLSGFGQVGAYAERAGVDQIAQGMSGLMSVTGPAGQGPWRAGIAISDTISGTFLTQGVLAALIHRDRTGRGQWVHTSLLESCINIMDFQACRWLTDGVVPAQEGNDHPTFFPMGCYRSSDGWVNIAGLKDLSAFVEVLGLDGVLDEPRFCTAEARRANRGAFTDLCASQLVRHTTQHWVEACNARSIPAGPVYLMDEVFADAHVQSLDLAVVVERVDDAPAQVLRHPVTLTATPATIRSGPPCPGAHTRVVLAELGYGAAEIDALLATGAAAEALGEGGGWLH
jgi:crotonobetainyl-CoA:carnitine CoA-transferase CaiB-like acyl-CoA transferase